MDMLRIPDNLAETQSMKLIGDLEFSIEMANSRQVVVVQVTFNRSRQSSFFLSLNFLSLLVTIISHRLSSQSHCHHPHLKIISDFYLNKSQFTLTLCWITKNVDKEHSPYYNDTMSPTLIYWCYKSHVLQTKKNNLWIPIWRFGSF